MLETRYQLHSYVISAKNYLEFKEKLNNKKQVIIEMKPTFIAGRMGDDLVIYAVNFNRKIYNKYTMEKE